MFTVPDFENLIANILENKKVIAKMRAIAQEEGGSGSGGVDLNSFIINVDVLSDQGIINEYQQVDSKFLGLYLIKNNDEIYHYFKSDLSIVDNHACDIYKSNQHLLIIDTDTQFVYRRYARTFFYELFTDRNETTGTINKQQFENIIYGKSIASYGYREKNRRILFHLLNKNDSNTEYDFYTIEKYDNKMQVIFINLVKREDNQADWTRYISDVFDIGSV